MRIELSEIRQGESAAVWSKWVMVYKKIFYLCLVLSLDLLTGCSAGFNRDDKASAAIGNTLYYQLINGNLKMWFWHNEDGSYTARTEEEKDGELKVVERSGLWAVKGQQFCRTQLVPDEAHFCASLSELTLKLGEERISSNGMFTVRLLKGRASID